LWQDPGGGADSSIVPRETDAETHEVIIVGGGPTGLMLAGELALADVDALVLERRPTPDLLGTRARGVHARTIEIFDQRGLADRFLSEGQTMQRMSFADTPLDVAGLPSRHPYTLALPQSDVERILRGWITELAVPTRYGADVIGIEQDDAGVDVALEDGTRLRTAYLVGADGGRSFTRRAVGIEFVGPPATRSHLIGEGEVDEQPPAGLRQDEIGIHGINALGDGSTVGFVVTERAVGPSTEPTQSELAEALRAVYGTDFGMSPTWISRFTDAARQAVDHRRGRVLIAGDAAHIHPPTGGQGIGLGVQDAVNLGWKLAQVVRGVSPVTLLDSYHDERHPATARVIKNVITQALLQRSDARTEAIRDTFAELLRSAEPRNRLAGLLTGLDVDHEPGDGHPLRGRRMPDLDLITPDGPRRVFELLHPARPLLLRFAGSGDLDITPWLGRVHAVDAEHAGDWMLPVVGVVTPPAAVLVRPDGHVVWVGDGTRLGLDEALVSWFGAPSTDTPTGS
jgi:3-(3-hydroxy-phenyl)propionate hydroxylase